MTGLVYKILADNFYVASEDKTFVCSARGILKENGILVGDRVEFNENENNITKVYARKNQLIRPPLANLNKLIIVISSVPKPDFMIVDKLILFSFCYGVEPIIVVNKIDLSENLFDEVKCIYQNVVKDILSTNALLGEGIDKLKSAMRGGLCAFAGQSAVGKSALVNNILKRYSSEVGEISIKNQKGKNTTRHCEIFIEDEIMVTDTAGFTSLDEKLLPIAYYELPYYYPDFLKYHDACKYKSCAHFNEKVEDCAVKRAVLENKIDRNRFLRYKEIYNTLLEKWVKTHG